MPAEIRMSHQMQQALADEAQNRIVPGIINLKLILIIPHWLKFQICQNAWVKLLRNL